MKQIQSSISFCLLVLMSIFIDAPAYGLDFTEFGAITLSQPNIQQSANPSIRANPGLSVGLGLSLGFRILSRIDFEPGLLYTGQSFSTSSSPDASQFTTWTAQVPILLRYWFSEKLSLGAGIYYSHGTGNVTKDRNSTRNYVGYQDLFWSTNEGGLCFSVRYRAPINELMSFVIDARELLGITNIDTSGNGTLQTRTLQVWGGISFIL